MLSRLEPLRQAVEPRESSQLTQLVASSVGSVVGQAAAKAARLGPIGALVGMIGGLGGFFLPIAFGALLDLTGVWTAPFMLLFVIVAISTVWMHVAIRRMERARHPALVAERYLSDVPSEPHPAPTAQAAAGPRPHAAAGPAAGQPAA